MRKICVVTGTRAEYGLLYWLMKEIQEDAALQLQLVVTGAHLSPRFGLTVRVIEEDGFQIDKKAELPLTDDSAVGVAKAVGTATFKLAEAFADLNPDLVVLLGDRFEILAAATAASLLRTPIAHIHGGESTLAAFDEAFRHAVTKMSLLHFAAAEPFRRKIIQMGESPDRVFCVGAPGLDHLARLKLLSRDELEKSLDFPLSPEPFLVTFHPVTLGSKSAEGSIHELLSALDAFQTHTVVFTGVNSDPDNRVIAGRIADYVKQDPARRAVYDSLGQLRYLSLMKHAAVVIGNSSSGIIEAPSVGTPTVNIGERQTGRLMAESVVQAAEDAASIRNAIVKALSPNFRSRLSKVHNPYGEPGASTRIKKILKDFPLSNSLLKKEFHLID